MPFEMVEPPPPAFGFASPPGWFSVVPIRLPSGSVSGLSASTRVAERQHRPSAAAPPRNISLLIFNFCPPEFRYDSIYSLCAHGSVQFRLRPRRIIGKSMLLAFGVLAVPVNFSKTQKALRCRNLRAWKGHRLTQKGFK